MHLLTIDQAEHRDKDGHVLWRGEKLKNVLHAQGEQFILSTVFAQGSGVTLPTTYYVGLDNRSTINVIDTLPALVGEPTGNGYARFAIDAASGMTAAYNGTIWTVTTSTVLFSAVGGSWGPVQNAFLCTGTNQTGYLISTVPLQAPRTLNIGDVYSFRMSLSIGG